MSYYTSLTVDVDLGDLAKTIAQGGWDVARGFILDLDEEVNACEFSVRLILDLIKAFKQYKDGNAEYWDDLVKGVMEEVTE